MILEDGRTGLVYFGGRGAEVSYPKFCPVLARTSSVLPEDRKLFSPAYYSPRKSGH